MLGQHLQTDVPIQWLAFCVYLEDRLTPANIRLVENDLSVEASRAQKGWVKDVRAVGRRHDYDVCIRIEAVHLDEDLV